MAYQNELDKGAQTTEVAVRNLGNLVISQEMAQSTVIYREMLEKGVPGAYAELEGRQEIRTAEAIKYLGASLSYLVEVKHAKAMLEQAKLEMRLRYRMSNDEEISEAALIASLANRFPAVQFNSSSVVAGEDILSDVVASHVFASYLPVVGDFVYLDTADKRFKPASNATAATSNVIMMVVSALSGGSLVTGSGFRGLMMGNRTTVTLGSFGSLATLQAIGPGVDAYISATAGKTGAAPATGSGLFARKLFSVPKPFADMTQSDLDSIKVVLMTGDSKQV